MRTVVVICLGCFLTLGLLLGAVRVSFPGAAANVLADLMIVGLITVAARSWSLHLRRYALSMRVVQCKQRAIVTVEAWIAAHREKQDQYAHLVGRTGLAPTVPHSYRQSWNAARAALAALERSTEKDVFRRAADQVGVAEQAAKEERIRLCSVLNPILRPWLTDVPGDEADDDKLPSQRGVPGWTVDEIRAKEAELVTAHDLASMVTAYLEKEHEVRDRLEQLRGTVGNVDPAIIAADHVPEQLPKMVKRIGEWAALTAVAIWLVVTVSSLIGNGNPGDFFGDVLNNLLCAAAVVAAGTAVGAYVRDVVDKGQASAAARPRTDIDTALAHARQILTRVVERDARTFFVTGNGIIERGSAQHWIHQDDGRSLTDALDTVRHSVSDLEQIRPAQWLSGFENQLSDFVLRFTLDAGPVRVPGNLLLMATFLMEDMQERVAAAFPDIEPADVAT